jgi:NADPH-dependent 2,4-dienoyl-CoA reductase/sulfur reductase-like enzyme
MSGELRQRFDVLVVGGGPAGMAAAACAAESGVRVGIVDDNASLGGQIWRGESQDHRTINVTQTPAGGRTQDAARWIERLQTAGAAALCGVRIFDQPEPGALLAEGLDGLFELRYENLVLATGARERFLPFPGWTLPNVMGAGGLQAMVKCGLPVRGKRVVVAGTGPLLLAVAAYLRKHGAEIPMICEQASWSSLARFGAALFGHADKLKQGLQLRKELAGIPFFANSWPMAAHGGRSLESLTVSVRGKAKTVPCDYLACGFHLVPNIELPLLLGCRIEAGCVGVGDFQETSVSKVFCAGEPTGIDGSTAIVQRARACAALCEVAGTDVPAACGTRQLAVAGDYCLPVRGHSVFSSALAYVLACGQASHALRHGSVSGQDMRAGSAILFWVESGFSAAAGLSCAG